MQLMLEVLKTPFLDNTFLNTLVTSLIMLSVIFIYADDTTFYSKCDQTSDLWQQLEWASKLESDL